MTPDQIEDLRSRVVARIEVARAAAAGADSTAASEPHYGQALADIEQLFADAFEQSG